MAPLIAGRVYKAEGQRRPALKAQGPGFLLTAREEPGPCVQLLGRCVAWSANAKLPNVVLESKGVQRHMALAIAAHIECGYIVCAGIGARNARSTDRSVMGVDDSHAHVIFGGREKDQAFSKVVHRCG